MTSVRVHIPLDSDADAAWAVIRDFTTGPARMAPGYVTGSRAAPHDGGAPVRLVTFATGSEVRERLVAVDDAERRIVYGVLDGAVVPEHDNAAMQVLPEGPGRSRLLWVRDVLPDQLGEPLRASMAAAAEHIRSALREPGRPG